MAPCTIATCRAASGGPCPRPGGVFVAGWLITLTAFSFQTRTMSVGSAASAEAGGMDAAAAMARIAITARQPRRRVGRVGRIAWVMEDPPLVFSDPLAI